MKKIIAPKDKYSYDIAISFLSKDEPLALEFHSRLSKHVSVFMYSKEQEKLAGTDGLESFRQAFRTESHMVVILFRDGWGKTDWTRVEETAIKERLLDEGWDWLFFVMLDRKATPPKWLPKNYIRFCFEDYGLEQAIGAVKARLQEIGGLLKPIDVIQEAKAVEQRKAFFALRERLFNSGEGVSEVRKEVHKLFEHVEGRIKEITSSTTIKIRAGTNAKSNWDQKMVVTDDRVSIVIYWRPRAANNLLESPLYVTQFNAGVLLPNERGYYFEEPATLDGCEYNPEFSSDHQWCWSKGGKPNEYLDSVGVGNECVLTFLSLANQVASGELKPPIPSFLKGKDEDDPWQSR